MTLRFHVESRPVVAVLAIVAVAVAAGCTTPQQMRDAVEERADWRERAEAPVERFAFSQLLDWVPLERDWVLLQFNGDRSLMVQLRQPCIADPREARSLSLVQTMPNSLNRNADRIRIDEWVCIIEQMRPVRAAAPTAAIDGGVHHSGGGT